jgi:polyhydroxyalkanoate synthesis repressor PhaR
VTEENTSAAEPVIIKKYANRRLYNTQTSSYVTLDHLCEMVKEGVDFEVRDARTGEDITRSVLTQIIFEEEAKGQNLLPIRFLRQLIRLYGDSLQSFVPGYLDLSMESFAKNQEAIKHRVAEAFGGGSQAFEVMARQNLAMFERAMKMFSPFGVGMPPRGEAEPGARNANGTAEPKTSEEISELKNEIEAMRKQLSELARERK